MVLLLKKTLSIHVRAWGIGRMDILCGEHDGNERLRNGKCSPWELVFGRQRFVVFQPRRQRVFQRPRSKRHLALLNALVCSLEFGPGSLQWIQR